MSETAKHRAMFLPYCVGNGLDIGYGGDPINDTAICFDRENRAHVGEKPQHLCGDARNLFMFNNNSLDYVFSSHCIEDMEDTFGVLVEWLRVIKIGGYLCLLFPDEQRYRTITNMPNLEHKHENFGLKYVWDVLTAVSRTKYHSKVYSLQLVFAEEWFNNDDYNVGIIVQKVGV